MRRAAVLGLGLMCMLGCVPKEDYDQLLVMNRSLESEREAAMQRAMDAEAQADALRNHLRARETELATERALKDNLQQENDRLETMMADMRGLMEKLDSKPQEPIIIHETTVLPPELDQALKAFAAAHPNAVEYDPARGVVKWKSDLLFASGYDVVRDESQSTLRSFANIIASPQASAFDVIVVGHTDNEPIKASAARGHKTNWHLSAHRAIAVADILINARINPDRVGVMGYGEFRPVTSNSTAVGMAKNRRRRNFPRQPGLYKRAVRQNAALQRQSSFSELT